MPPCDSSPSGFLRLFLSPSIHVHSCRLCGQTYALWELAQGHSSPMWPKEDSHPGVSDTNVWACRCVFSHAFKHSCDFSRSSFHAFQVWGRGLGEGSFYPYNLIFWFLTFLMYLGILSHLSPCRDSFILAPGF